MNALNPPPEALTDPKAVEFARIWAAHSQQHVSLRVDQWKHNPGVWGIMLCDLAHHVDLRLHHGVHPRLGAVDVVPFVPLGATAMDAAVAARDAFAAWV